MRPNNSIWYVILSYKSNPVTLKKNITFFKQKNILVVNNCSNDNSLKGISGVTLVKNERNLGYTGGMNIGMEHAFKNGGEWVVLLNDDVELSEEGIQKLEEELSTQDSGVVGLYEGYLEKKRWTTILPTALQDLKGILRFPLVAQDDRRGKNNPDYISGSFFAIHKDVYKRIHGFNEKFFMYYEDVDYCLRAKEQGFPIIKLNLPNIHHQEGTSIHRNSFLHQYYLARNHLLFVEKNAPLSVKLYELVRLPKTIWEHTNNKEDGALEGIKDYFLRNFGPHQKSL